MENPEVRMNFCAKKITTQNFDPVNYVIEIVMTDFDAGLNILEFLQPSFHVTGTINFHQRQISSLNVMRNF